MTSWITITDLLRWAPLVCGLALLWPAIRVLLPAARGRLHARGRCQVCAFSLESAASDRCPECGTPIARARIGLAPHTRVSGIVLAALLGLPLGLWLLTFVPWLADRAFIAARFPETSRRLGVFRGDRSACESVLGSAGIRSVEPTLLRTAIEHLLEQESSRWSPEFPLTELTQDLATSVMGLVGQGRTIDILYGPTPDQNFDVLFRAVLDHIETSATPHSTGIDLAMARLVLGPGPVTSFGTTISGAGPATRHRTLTPEQESMLAGTLLARTADRTRPWNRYWGVTFEALALAGKLSPAQIEQYIAHAAEPVLVLPEPTLYAGEALTIAIVPSWHIGSNLPFELSFTPDPACAAYIRPSQQSTSFFAHSPVYFIFTPPRTPGPFTISGTLTLSFGGAASGSRTGVAAGETTGAFWRSVPQRTITRRVEATCTIVVDEKTPPP